MSLSSLPHSNRRIQQLLPRHVPELLLVVVIVTGLYMRTANVGRIQQFSIDQATMVMKVMDWVQEGKFPLLGPTRAASRDHNIGPGWYYTLAPALAVSGFHPAAGAMLICLFQLAGVLLAFYWLRRTTGNPWLALAVTVIFYWSAEWVEMGRNLWHPHMLLFAVIVLGFLFDGMQRRPVPCLAAIVMFYALLPQWHSSSFIMMAAGVPFILAGIVRSREGLANAPARQWAIWGVALLAVILTLYVPPVIYELQNPGHGNLGGYLARTFLPGPPESMPLIDRIVAATDRLSLLATKRMFFSSVLDRWVWLRRTLTALVAALFFGFYGISVLRWPRQALLSAGFFAATFGAYYVSLILKYNRMQDYYFKPMLHLPLLLAGWTLGQALRFETTRVWLRNAARAGAVALILFGLILTARQLPIAWGFHNGKIWYRQTFENVQNIAKYIVDDAGGRPFSCLVMEDKSFETHAPFAYLFRYYGQPSTIKDSRHVEELPRALFGERVYVVARNKYASIDPRLAGLSVVPYDPPSSMANARIYAIPAARIPAGVKSVRVAADGNGWVIQAVRQ